jgi:hypothetical protein
MTRHDCDICRGNGIVRLPIYRRVMAFSANEMADPTPNHRDYPCPECGDSVTMGQVQALRQEAFATTMYANEPGFIQHVREGLAHQIVSQLLKDGYTTVKRGPDDSREMRFQMVATVGVVHPSRLDTLEQRIAENQDQVAREVANEAAHQIDNWGSHYGHADILKRDARQMIIDALQIVMKRRSLVPRPHSTATPE